MKFDTEAQYVMYNLKQVEPEVLFHIQDGGRRHLEISKTRYNSVTCCQILMSFGTPLQKCMPI